LDEFSSIPNEVVDSRMKSKSAPKANRITETP